MDGGCGRQARKALLGDAGWSVAGWRKGKRLLGEAKKHLLGECRGGRHLLGGCRAERDG